MADCQALSASLADTAPSSANAFSPPASLFSSVSAPCEEHHELRRRKSVMRVLRLRNGGGLDHLRLEDMPDPGEPGPGEIRVRIKAVSLNFHDLDVVSGRRLMSD